MPKNDPDGVDPYFEDFFRSSNGDLNVDTNSSLIKLHEVEVESDRKQAPKVGRKSPRATKGKKLKSKPKLHTKAKKV